jgi:hypothetical protein
MAGGRPTTYTKKMADRICEIVATNRHGLKKLCIMFEELPDDSTIRRWAIMNPGFSAQYLNAKRQQIDIVMEEIDEIIDENLRFYHDDHGNERIDSPSASIAIAKANNKKWFASKLAPSLYGDKKEEQKQESTSLLEKLITGEIKVSHE